MPSSACKKCALRSEEHTSELHSLTNIVCRLLLEKKKMMPNHFHLLIRTGTKSLSELMHKLLTGYAVYFNTRYEGSGYLYQNRYKSILCQEDHYLLELVRYIHLNPLRARLVKDISELNEYKWSGHQALLGAAIHVFQTTGEILEHFDSNRTEAVKKYLAFIDEAKDTGKRRDLSGGGLKRSLAGWDSIKELKENWRGDERLLGDVDFVNEVLKISEENLKKKEKLKKDGWDINRVIKLSCNLMGIDEANILKFSRKDKASQARSLAAFWLNRDLGINMAEIGRYF